MKNLARNGLRALALLVALGFAGVYVAYAMGYLRLDPAWFPWNAASYQPPDIGDPSEPRLVALIMDDDINFVDLDGKRVYFDRSELGKPMGYVRRGDLVLSSKHEAPSGITAIDEDRKFAVYTFDGDSSYGVPLTKYTDASPVPMVISTKNIGMPIFEIKRGTLFPKVSETREGEDMLGVWAVWYIPATGFHRGRYNSSFDDPIPQWNEYDLKGMKSYEELSKGTRP